MITLNVTGEDQLFTNRAQILFTEQAETGLDRFDAPRLSDEGLASQWLSFHSLDEEERQYAFQSVPASNLSEEKIRIPLDIQSTESGQFKLDWALPESHVFNGNYYLKDHKTGEVIELRKGSSYSFEIATDQVQKPQSVEKVTTLNLTYQAVNSSFEPRFELLITSHSVDGLTELGVVPDNFTLAQNYPNPFNPTTIISY